MQPNEQEPTQPPATPPAQPGGYPDAPVSPSAPTPAAPPQTPPGTIVPSFTTPDFFKLDPIADPMLAVEAKKRKKKLLIILTVAVVFVALVAFLVYLILLSNSPYEKFYRVIEKNVQHKYVSVEYIMASKDEKNKITVKTTTDYSSLKAPKTTTSYQAVDINPEYPRSRTIEEINLGNSEYFDRVTTADENLSQKLKDNNLELNKWYTVKDNSRPKGLSRAVGVPVSPRSIPTLFITGGFIDEVSSRFIDNIKSQNIYNATSENKNVFNGEEMSVYQVGIDLDKLLKIGNEAFGSDIIKNPAIMSSIVDKSTKYEFWVDKNDEIRRITFNAKTPSVYTSREIVLEYPSSVEIKKPNEVSDEK